ncbi:MAG: oxidoreductase [Rhodobacteraceae bacterium]|nr:oxidoreductase [Paracoccaceae bacterium]
MKFGIIGASFARKAYLPALAHVDGAEVVAISSGRIDSARSAAEAFGIPHVHDDWEDMLGSHALDAVLIATPTDLHAPMVLRAIESGAHVLCEKPMAMDAVEAQTMLRAAETARRLHMIDHELRFNPNHMRIAELIGDGSLGDIRHVNIANIGSAWSDPAGRSAGDWWSLDQRGGGRLGANGSHQVDLLRWWLGPVKSVSGQVATCVADRTDPETGTPWTATADDLTRFSLETTGGVLADVFISAVAATNMGNITQIFGSRGTIELGEGGDRLRLSRDGGAFEDISVADPAATLPGVNGGIWNVSVVSALREFAAAAREGRALRRGATFHDGLANQRVLDAVRLSSRDRRWIDLDP